MQGAQPSNPLGYGAAEFLNSFAGAVQNRSKTQEAQRFKEQFDKWHQDLLQQRGDEQIDRRGGQQRKTNAAKPATASGKAALSKEFFNTFQKNDDLVRKTVAAYTGNPMNMSPAMRKATKGLTQEQATQLAYQDMQIHDHPAHAAYIYTHDPGNLNNYHQLLERSGAATTAFDQPGAAQPTGGVQLPAPGGMQNPAPGGAPAPGGMPMPPPGGAPMGGLPPLPGASPNGMPQ